MNRTLRARLLSAVETDRQAEQVDGVWRTRCLHCRAALHLSAAGEPLDGGSLEHVVPRSWFEKRAAVALTAGLSGPDDPRNLALVCRRCNHQKGSGPDARGPAHPRAREIVETLQAKRLERFLAAGQPTATRPET